MKKIYNKLVRDNIPKIIKRERKNVKFKILGKEEYVSELFKKVLEEVREMIAARNNSWELKKEIGDVYEVIEAIMAVKKLKLKEIKTIKKKREKERGAFKKRIFLEEES